jgi:hypothetical protein
MTRQIAACSKFDAVTVHPIRPFGFAAPRRGRDCRCHRDDTLQVTGIFICPADGLTF